MRYRLAGTGIVEKKAGRVWNHHATYEFSCDIRYRTKLISHVTQFAGEQHQAIVCGAN